MCESAVSDANHYPPQDPGKTTLYGTERFILKALQSFPCSELNYAPDDSAFKLLRTTWAELYGSVKLLATNDAIVVTEQMTEKASGANLNLVLMFYNIYMLLKIIDCC